jgi:hypothetical protein
VIGSNAPDRILSLTVDYLLILFDDNGIIPLPMAGFVGGSIAF